VHWANIAVGGGALVTAIGGLLAAMLWLRRWARPRLEAHDQFMQDWHGEPERRGVAGQLIAEARPGVMEQLRTLKGLPEQVQVVRNDVSVLRGEMTEVKSQLRPNGGESVYDKVTRTAEVVEGMQT